MASGAALTQTLKLVDAGAAGSMALAVTVHAGVVEAAAFAAMQTWDGRRWSMTSQVGLTATDLVDLHRALTRLVRDPVGAAGVVEWWATEPLGEVELRFGREAASPSISLDVDIGSAVPSIDLSARWAGIDRTVVEMEQLRWQVRALLVHLGQDAGS